MTSSSPPLPERCPPVPPRSTWVPHGGWWFSQPRERSSSSRADLWTVSASCWWSRAARRLTPCRATGHSRGQSRPRPRPSCWPPPRVLLTDSWQSGQPGPSSCTAESQDSFSLVLKLVTGPLTDSCPQFSKPSTRPSCPPRPRATPPCPPCPTTRTTIPLMLQSMRSSFLLVTTVSIFSYLVC